MNIIWGWIVLLLSSLAYFGQLIAAFWPGTAEKLGMTESESDVDPVFYADVRGEIFLDICTLWTLPLAGLLLVLNNSFWVYLGLIGGSMYLYFAGRGIIVRRMMLKRGIPIGSRENLKINYIFLFIWGTMAIITIIIAINNLLVSSQ